MPQLVINSVSFYTVRETLQTTWRGGYAAPRAIGRFWTIQVVCETQGELTSIHTLIDSGTVAVVFPNGLAVSATITRGTHNPFADGYILELSIQEVN